MYEDAVEPQEHAEPIEQIMDQQEADTNAPEENVQEEKPEKTMIPLSVAQKLREKNKELELRLQWEQQEREKALSRTPQDPPEDDSSRFESATREDLSKAQQEAIRTVEERFWIKSNVEKFEYVNEHLPQFLKQRPNLTSAIAQSTNRYEEAYTLMTALSPKQQQQFTKSVTPKKEAPNAPGGVPKAAALNEAVDLMSMSDQEFAAWRQTHRRKR